MAPANGTRVSNGPRMPPNNSTNGDRYKFTGRELDSESGLRYNDARYYDAKLAQRPAR